MTQQSCKYRLIFIRHGESTLNKLKRSWSAKHAPWWIPWAVLLDRLFPRCFFPEIDARLAPLTENGRLQASQTGAWLRSLVKPRDALFFHSPLARAIETANVLGIAEDWNVDSSLVERSWGVRDKFLLFPSSRFLEALRPKDPNGLPRGSETFDTLNARWLNFLANLQRSAAQNERIRDFVIVSHGEFIAAVCLILLRLPIQEEVDRTIILPNCGVIVVSAENLTDLLTGIGTTVQKSALGFSVHTEGNPAFERRFGDLVTAAQARSEKLE